MSDNDRDETLDPTADSTPPPAASKERKRKIPEVPKVFGRHGWMIVLLPYLVFYLGSAFTSYLDGARAETAIHEQQHTVITQMHFAQLDIAAELDPGALDQMRQIDTLAELSFNEPMQAALARLNWTELDRLAKLPEELKADDLRLAAQSFLNADESLRNLMRPETYEAASEQIRFLIELLELDEEGLKRQVMVKFYEHAHADDQGELPPSETARFLSFQPDRTWYPSLYTINIAVTSLLMFIVFPFYFRAPFKLTFWGVAVGVVGIFVWIGLWWVDKQFLHLGGLQKGGRAAFNPFEELKDNPTWMYQFMAIRFWGLVVVVPFVEEFFLRGWLMRYIDHPDWDTVPLGLVTKLSAIGIGIYAVATHTYEPLAAVVWFSMVTWLYWKTKSIWDCVLAHMITNLLLGLFVLQSGYWELW